jgi:hypothetical protein
VPIPVGRQLRSLTDRLGLLWCDMVKGNVPKSVPCKKALARQGAGQAARQKESACLGWRRLFEMGKVYCGQKANEKKSYCLNTA